MTATEKLAEVRIRISDLGCLLADIAKTPEDSIARLLYKRLWAIREIILDETPA